MTEAAAAHRRHRLSSRRREADPTVGRPRRPLSASARVAKGHPAPTAAIRSRVHTTESQTDVAGVSRPVAHGLPAAAPAGGYSNNRGCSEYSTEHGARGRNASADVHTDVDPTPLIERLGIIDPFASRIGRITPTGNADGSGRLSEMPSQPAEPASAHALPPRVLASSTHKHALAAPMRAVPALAVGVGRRNSPAVPTWPTPPKLGCGAPYRPGLAHPAATTADPPRRPTSVAELPYEPVLHPAPAFVPRRFAAAHAVPVRDRPGCFAMRSKTRRRRRSIAANGGRRRRNAAADRPSHCAFRTSVRPGSARASARML
jgi:hypothetical protein